MKQSGATPTEQVAELWKIAVQNGLRDAADFLSRAWLQQVFGPRNPVNPSPVAEPEKED
jgi:hypothetical protein